MHDHIGKAYLPIKLGQALSGSCFSHLECLVVRKIGACCAIATLLTVILSPLPATAFGLRIGPFHFGFPFFGHRHHHYLYMHARPDELSRGESQQGSSGQSISGRGITSALLYPQLALPAMFESIFSPSYATSWPFDYQSIFLTAFARVLQRQNPHLCEPQSDLANDIVGRLSAGLTPSADQQQLLQRLGGAIGAASALLAKSCPSEIPTQPVARLQLMESQIEELAMALDMIHQPLQAFSESLSDEQRARFAAVIAAPGFSDRDNGMGCGTTSAATDWSINQIDRSVRPTAPQRDAVIDVKQAFDEAATDLEAHCPTSAPPTALSRLEAIEARLDATWRAALSIQVALANFETKLSEEQKGRFDRMNFAAR